MSIEIVPQETISDPRSPPNYPVSSHHSLCFGYSAPVESLHGRGKTKCASAGALSHA